MREEAWKANEITGGALRRDRAARPTFSMDQEARSAVQSDRPTNARGRPGSTSSRLPKRPPHFKLNMPQRETRRKNEEEIRCGQEAWKADKITGGCVVIALRGPLFY